MAKDLAHSTESVRTSPDPSSFRNAILASLPADEARELRPHLTRARLVRGQILMEPGERVDQCWFIEQGFVSMVAPEGEPGGGVEVGLIGREGMVGLVPLVSGHPLTFTCAMVQMPGEARRIPLATLQGYAERLPALRRRLLRALAVEMAQVAVSAACIGRHTVAERSARWLLLACDRLGSPEIALTQEFLAMMLAVRRPGVTMALNRLQRAGLIRSHRAVITVLDRPGLEEAACDCYGRLIAFERRLAEPGDQG